jgi:hypothetical protein
MSAMKIRGQAPVESNKHPLNAENNATPNSHLTSEAQLMTIYNYLCVCIYIYIYIYIYICIYTLFMVLAFLKRLHSKNGSVSVSRHGKFSVYSLFK